MKIIKLLLAALLIVGCQSKEEEPKKEPTVEKKDEVSFVAVGDNLMHERLMDVAKTDDGHDFKPYYRNIQPYIKKADLSFVNQETILGGNDLGLTGFPFFNTPEVMAKNLSEVGFDIVNGATNHAFDKGFKGIVNSIHTFKEQEDLTYIGLIENKEDRDNIPVIEKKGIKIGLLAYNQYNETEDDAHRYAIGGFDEAKIRRDVENAKEVSDIVIVSCHWGEEFDIEPNNFQRTYAKKLADLGVDIIIGTHSHTLQPVEWVEGKDGHKTLVAYSLGNFVNGMLEEESQLGGMLSFNLKKENNIVSIKDVTLVPLLNHYEVTDASDIMKTRKGFTIYRLKDYTDKLASQHGLNGYNGIEISRKKMMDKVKERMTSGIKIDQ